ncbi:MAG: hypothetical protein IPK01_00780 [Acidobacteria bacterium]|nr:hypothetical protein [Acidobacteriota bacterium]
MNDREQPPNENKSLFYYYVRKQAELLFGLYTYIDPYKVRSNEPSDNQMPFTLWGRERFRNEEIKPSFEIPIFITLDNDDGEKSLVPVDNDFKKFIQSINQVYRETQPFQKQDFIKLFNDNRYLGRKRNKRDLELGILYIPSGEIDHCIFQLLAFLCCGPWGEIQT